jgi:hypothetical protein
MVTGIKNARGLMCLLRLLTLAHVSPWSLNAILVLRRRLRGASVLSPLAVFVELTYPLRRVMPVLDYRQLCVDA